MDRSSGSQGAGVTEPVSLADARVRTLTAKVINFSTNGRMSLALAKVVLIWPCSIKL